MSAEPNLLVSFPLWVLANCLSMCRLFVGCYGCGYVTLFQLLARRPVNKVQTWIISTYLLYIPNLLTVHCVLIIYYLLVDCLSFVDCVLFACHQVIGTSHLAAVWT